MSDLPSKLRSIMAVRGLRQNELAAEAGLSQAYISDLLARTRGISPTALDKLMDAIGVDSRKMRRKLHLAGARDSGWKI